MNWFIPALVKSSVGIVARHERRAGHDAWPCRSKYSRKRARISLGRMSICSGPDRGVRIVRRLRKPAAAAPNPLAAVEALSASAFRRDEPRIDSRSRRRSCRASPISARSFRGGAPRRSARRRRGRRRPRRALRARRPRDARADCSSRDAQPAAPLDGRRRARDARARPASSSSAPSPFSRGRWPRRSLGVAAVAAIRRRARTAFDRQLAAREQLQRLGIGASAIKTRARRVVSADRVIRGNPAAADAGLAAAPGASPSRRAPCRRSWRCPGP